MRVSAMVTAAQNGGKKEITLVSGDGRKEFLAAVKSGEFASVELATLTASKRWRAPLAQTTAPKQAAKKKR